MITVDKPIKKIFEKVGNSQYYRFSGKLDDIHLVLPSASVSLCGKPLLSSNYARFKPTGAICEDCVKKVNEMDNNINQTNVGYLSQGIYDKDGKKVYVYYICDKKTYALISYKDNGIGKFKVELKRILDVRTKQPIEIK